MSEHKNLLEAFSAIVISSMNMFYNVTLYNGNEKSIYDTMFI